MISKRHHARISRKKSDHDFILRPYPLVTHSESRAQIQSYLSRFIPSNKRLEKINDSLVSHIKEGGGRVQIRDRGWVGPRLNHPKKRRDRVRKIIGKSKNHRMFQQLAFHKQQSTRVTSVQDLNPRTSLDNDHESVLAYEMVVIEPGENSNPSRTLTWKL